MTSSTLVRPVHAPAGNRSSSTRASEIAIAGRGATLESAFEDATAATFALMADVRCLRPERTIPVSFLEREHGPALARWLELLLDAAREHHLVFGEFHLQRERDLWWGCATGERRRAPLLRHVRIARAGHAVSHTAEGWEARCLAHCRPPMPAMDQRTRVPG